MPRKRKIVLTVSPEGEKKLPGFVEDCLRGEVKLIAVAGENCERIHDLIDELIVGDALNKDRFILTTFHNGENVGEVIEFTNSHFEGEEYGDEIEIVNL